MELILTNSELLNGAYIEILIKFVSLHLLLFILSCYTHIICFSHFVVSLFIEKLYIRNCSNELLRIKHC